MITLITGMPGAGKTSNTLWDFLQDNSGRPRFTTPIKGFDAIANGIGELPDLSHWQELPDGALVLVDEAQTFLRPRGTGGKVPEWIAAFETHRHRGFDFLFITQHPSLIDSHARRLVQKHVHYHRPWNLKAATRYEWEQIQANPDLPTARNSGLTKRVQPNKEVFKFYTSTVLDTHKAALPWKWILTLSGAFLFVVAVAVYMVSYFNRLQHKNELVPQTKPPISAATVTAPGQLPQASGAITVASLTPRIEGMPWTAPVYDNLTEPTDFPRIAACIATASSCNCYTQQATPIEASWAICRNIVAKGIFDPWASGRDNDRPGLSNGPEPERQRPTQTLPQSQAIARSDSYWSDPVAGGAAPLPSETFISRH